MHGQGKAAVRITLAACVLVFFGIVGAGAQQEPRTAAGKKGRGADQAMPSPVVAVIDFQRVVKRSSAGKSIRQQIDTRHAAFQKEIKEIQGELEKARAELSERPAGMTDSEFKKKRERIRKRVGELQNLAQQRKREMDTMFNAGMRQVDIALIAVLKELAKEHGINLILNAGRGRGLVLFAEKRIVITEEALRRLNARLPKVELTKPESGK
jgi:outer membrane protein